MIAWVTKGLTGMPIFVCYSLAYTISCISPSIIVPECLSLISQGYGRKKGIPNGLIAAGTSDGILCIVMYGIFSALAFFQTNGEGHEGETLGHKIGMIFLEIAGGLIVGVVTGLMGWLFKFTQTWKFSHLLKAAYILILAIGFTIASSITGFKGSKYIASIICGYLCQIFWKEHKPSRYLEVMWLCIKYFIFSCVGANIDLKLTIISHIPFGIVCIVCGLILRVLTTFLVTYSKIYTIKERLFMAVCWIPKATV